MHIISKRPFNEAANAYPNQRQVIEDLYRVLRKSELDTPEAMRRIFRLRGRIEYLLSETRYQLEAGQILVPPTAAEREGIQPVVTLRANGAIRAEVDVGQAVEFTADIEVPSGPGLVVSAGWDCESGPEVVAIALSGPQGELQAKVDLLATPPYSCQ